MDTTIGILDPQLYHHITPQALLSWQRQRVANMLATSGEEWYNYFRQHNAGTSYIVQLCMKRKACLGCRTCDQKFANSNFGYIAANIVVFV